MTVSPMALVQSAQRHVGLGGGALDDAQRPHDRGRLLLPADLEIAQGALGLCPQYRLASTSMVRRCRFRCGLGHEKASFEMDWFLRQSLLRNESRLTTSPAFPAGLAATGSGASASPASGGWWAPSPDRWRLGSRRPRRGIAGRTVPGIEKSGQGGEGICSGAGSFLKVKVTSK